MDKPWWWPELVNDEWRARIHTRRGETDGGAHNVGYCRGRHDVALDIARAIRALPGKEGE